MEQRKIISHFVMAIIIIFSLLLPIIANSAAGDYLWFRDWNNRERIIRFDKTTYGTESITLSDTAYDLAVDDYNVYATHTYSDKISQITRSSFSIKEINCASPNYIALDESYIWVTTWQNPTVRRIGKSDFSITVINVGNDPMGIAVDESYAWVVNRGDDTVTRINKSTLAKNVIPVGDFPWSIVLDDDYAYVGNAWSNYITRIDKSNLLTVNIPAPDSANRVAVDDNYIWVEGDFPEIRRIRKSDFNTDTLILSDNADGIVMDYNYVWVPTDENYMIRITKSNLVLTNMNGGFRPSQDSAGYYYDYFFSTAYTFPPDSDLFTNKYFSKFVLGARAEYTGYGNENGKWRNLIVNGRTTYSNIKCLIVRADESDGEYTVMYLAQDSKGDIRCLRAFGYSEDDGNFDQDFSSDPVLLIPQNPIVNQTWTYFDGGTVTVESLNDLVPQMSTGQGPFANCLRMKWQIGADIDYIYWSPTGLFVKFINDDGGIGGYELDKFEVKSDRAMPWLPLLLLDD